MARITTTLAITLFISLLVGLQAEAYWVQPDPGGSRIIQLHIEDSWDAWCLALFADYAADVVLYVAERQGMQIERSKASIEGEIRAHAFGYLDGNHGQPFNPMDIEMYPAPWWFYLLD